MYSKDMSHLGALGLSKESKWKEVEGTGEGAMNGGRDPNLVAICSPVKCITSC